MRIKPKKSLGQNFLRDTNILDLIIKISRIDSVNTVVEIGPGTGNLTEKIVVKNPKKIIVFEKDKDLSVLLKKKFLNKIEIINEDFMKIKEKQLEYENLVILGNLPYNVSSQILVKLIKIINDKIKIKKLILMFQKEVAERIIAKTGSKNYGRLSIFSQWRMKTIKIKDIKPDCFFPKPKVMSSLVELTPKKEFFKIENPKNLEYVTNTFFRFKRKMIKKPLKILFNNYDEVVTKLNLDLSLRPQKLTPDIFYKICQEFEKLTY